MPLFLNLEIEFMEDETVIKNFSNYEIYNAGRIYSRLNDIFMKPYQDKYGYNCIHLLRDDGCYKGMKVHRLVALAFIPNPDNLPQVNHKDGDKLNNSVENLEWCTAQYNTQHAYDNGLTRFNEGLREHITELGRQSAKEVIYTNLNTSEERIFPSLRKACSELSLNYDSVRAMLSRNKPYLSIHSFSYV